jgi:IS30 family transposase
MKSRKNRKEFSHEERQFLHVMLSEGKKFPEIAKKLNRDRRVVKRAAERYKPKSPFVAMKQTPLERARHDHEEHKKRLGGSKNRLRLGSLERQEYVETRLSKATPELIAGRYKSDHPGHKMSHETIYQWIYRDRRDLIQYLDLVSKRGRNKRTSSNKYRHKEPAAPKCSITERPEEANKRKRIGDLERDTVHGVKGSDACVLNISDRKSRLVILEKLHACNSEAVKSASKRRLEKIPKELKLTMTQDNGPENSLHAEEEKETGIKHFFCHPYAAYERGTVEVLNRYAVRRNFPKGSDFSIVNFAQIKSAETAFNNRPMKCLDFQTPLEVFAKELKKYNLTPEQVGLTQIPW